MDNLNYHRKNIRTSACVWSILFILSFQGLAVHGMVPETYQGLYLVSFLNFSTDRTVDVLQQLAVSSVNQDVKFRTHIPIVGHEEVQVLDATNSRQNLRELTEDLGIPKEQSISKSAAIIASEGGKQIWVQANKMEHGTTGMYQALPITSQSTEFFLASYGGSVVGHTALAFAALKDGTCLEAWRVKGNTWNRMGLWHLDAMDVYTALDNSDLEDYTGLYVNSTRPIGAYGVNECAQISKGIQYCDAIVEQMPPVAEYGSQFVVGQIAGRTATAGYEIRVVAAQMDTVVTVHKDGAAAEAPVTIHRGEYHEVLVANTATNVFIKTSKPALVVQYGKSQAASGTTDVPADPYMTLVAPIDRYDHLMKFRTGDHFYQGAKYTMENYITISSDSTSTVRFDGNPVTSAWKQVDGLPSHYTTSFKITPGFHTLDAGTPVVGWVYGHGTKDNTGYGFSTAYKYLNGAASKIEGPWYDIADLTTTPIPVDEPIWITANWTDADFSWQEMPAYIAKFRMQFVNVARETKIISEKCSKGFHLFLANQRFPVMAAAVKDGINTGALCPQLGASNVTLSMDEKDYFTEYTRGFVNVTVSIQGSLGMTFRNLSDCAAHVRAYVEDLANWPAAPVGSGGITNDMNFLQNAKTYNATLGDCADVRIFPARLTPLSAGWGCNNNDLIIIGGAMTRACASLYLILAAVMTAMWNYL